MRPPRREERRTDRKKVFCRIVTRNGGQAAGKGKVQRSVDDLVERLVAEGISFHFIWGLKAGSFFSRHE